MRRGAMIAGAALLAAACAAPDHRVHHSLLGTTARPLPQRAVVLHVKASMSEVSAGGVVEELPGLASEAEAIVRDALAAELAKRDADGRDSFELLELPGLTPAQQAVVNEHAGLYAVVAGAALAVTRGGASAWEHKLDHFDYSIGSGLAFLSSRAGADAGIVIISHAIRPSAGRVGMAIVAEALGAGMGTGGAIVHVGIVDLMTGDLLWMDDDAIVTSGSMMVGLVNEPSDFAPLVHGALDAYPGLEYFDETR